MHPECLNDAYQDPTRPEPEVEKDTKEMEPYGDM